MCAGILVYFYHLIFDATASTQVFLRDEKHVVIEGIFIGKQIGEFSGIAATGKDGRVPLHVVYDLENNRSGAAQPRVF